MKAGKIWGQTELIHANNSFEFHRIEFKKNFNATKIFEIRPRKFKKLVISQYAWAESKF